ncbi:hypothetical protein Tco_0953840 [Tanacetum coccineum]|uniref:Reverse transcriptase domain-containing protein n=1 Tax=Tanacetum coccineum TaxID=301880 RepID=A0ABQ5E105_9ASTR
MRNHPDHSRECRLHAIDRRSYADLKRKPMEFQVGDKVMLKVSPWKGVVRFNDDDVLGVLSLDSRKALFYSNWIEVEQKGLVLAMKAILGLRRIIGGED